MPASSDLALIDESQAVRWGSQGVPLKSQLQEALSDLQFL